MSIATAPEPLPQPQIVSAPKVSLKAAPSSADGGDGGSGGRASSRFAAAQTQSRLEAWQDSLKTWSRQALLFPLSAFVLALLPSESETEADVFGMKVKATLIGREIVTLGVAMLLVKLARDAARLLVAARSTDVGLDLATQATPKAFFARTM